MPRVTVGIPVYNGEPFLAGALDCWLAQDFTDFEIVVSDNASTDDTPRILEKYAARDPRIRITRRSETVPAEINFNGLASAGVGEMFVWGACDDLWEPSFLRRMVEALDANPDASAAYCPPRYFGDRGPLRGHHALGDVPAGSRGAPLARAIEVLRSSNWLPVYGLIRRDALRRTRLLYQPMGIAYDVGLVIELALLGPVVQVPEELMATRLRADAVSRTQRSRVYDAGAQRFVEGLALAPAQRRLFAREVRIYCRKGSKPRRGIWRWAGFRSSWVKLGRLLVDAERALWRTG